jgi:NifU-like protein involved in Fe-S cluster formation
LLDFDPEPSIIENRRFLSEIIKCTDTFANPRNIGEIKEADGVGKVGNPVCVDMGI